MSIIKNGIEINDDSIEIDDDSIYTSYKILTQALVSYLATSLQMVNLDGWTL